MFRIDRRLLEHFDYLLMLLLILTCGMAIFNLYSASMPLKSGLAPYFKQGIIMGGGFILIFLICAVDYKHLHTINYTFYLLVIFSLVLAEIIGSTAGGSQRWISLGFFNYQPSEVAKLMLVITLASFYTRNEILDGYGICKLTVPIVLTLIPFGLIAAQPDLGTALMLAFIFVYMSFFVRLKWSAMLILATIAAAGAVFGWIRILKPYQKQRVETFLNPELDPMHHGYQIIQSKIAVGSGGLFGAGWMQGKQGHLNFLPERHTDFAFAVWAEEWGFVGSMIFLGCYFAILFWGLYVAMNAKDRFGTLLAYGVVMLIFWQAVINLFMVMGWLPVVGIPLPLVSYGGSSLITTFGALGILMNVRMRRFNPLHT